MTIIEAILKVMKEAGRPLSPREAYDLVIEKKLYEFKAQNPLGVLSGQIRRHAIGLEFPTANSKKYFRLESSGKFSSLERPVVVGSNRRPKRPRSTSRSHRRTARSLSSTFDELKVLRDIYTDLLKERILSDLKKISPAEFEYSGKQLLDVYGFQDVRVTSISNDGGIDGYGKLKVGLAHMRVAFQCKRWTRSNVGRPEIDRFRGAIQGQYEQGIFFTTASFVPAAMDASIRPGAVPVVLVDGPGLVELMIERRLGVQEESLTLHTYALDTILADESNSDRG